VRKLAKGLRLRDIAGSGPVTGIACGLVFSAACVTERALGLPPLGGPRLLWIALAGALFAVTAVVFLVCLRDMPLAKHSRALVTTGIYARVRPPRYAAMALCAYPGAALLLRGPLCLASTVVAALVVKGVTRLEEAKLIGIFGEEYVAYMHATPALIPSLRRRRR
jgi:protein-S-isoprenylcysteine O-methyltransferase Ste14